MLSPLRIIDKAIAQACSKIERKHCTKHTIQNWFSLWTKEIHLQIRFSTVGQKMFCALRGGGAHTSLTTVNLTVPSWHSLKGAHVWSVLFCDIVLLKLLKGCTSTRAVYRAQARLSPQSMDSMASVSTNALRPGVEWLSATARLAVVNYISCCLIIISKILEMPPCTVSKSRHWRGLIVRKAAIAAVSVCVRALHSKHTLFHMRITVSHVSVRHQLPVIITLCCSAIVFRFALDRAALTAYQQQPRQPSFSWVGANGGQGREAMGALAWHSATGLSVSVP